MISQSITNGSKNQIYRSLLSLALVVTVLCVEAIYFFYIKIIDDSNVILIDDGFVNPIDRRYTQYLREHGGGQFFLAAYSQIFVGYVFFAFAIAIGVFLAKDASKSQLNTALLEYRVRPVTLAINILSFLILLGLMPIFASLEFIIANPGSLYSIIYTLSPIIWCAFATSALSLVFTPATLVQWYKRNTVLAFGIFIVMVVLWNRASLTFLEPAWADLLLKPTLVLSSSIARLFGINVLGIKNTPAGHPQLGTSRFEVEIWDSCSGYEGMTIVAVMLVVYCFAQRHVLRFPRSLLSVPFAGVAMFLLNSLRIAVLIAIGDLWSPAIAMGGFHSVGGWINLIVVLTITVAILNHTPFFLSHVSRQKSFQLNNTDFLLPLAVFIGTSLLAKSVSVEFSWAYPVPVLATLCVLFVIRRSLLSALTKATVLSMIVGVVTFFLWIYLIPEEAEKSTSFYTELSSVPIGLSIVWILFRVVGAAVVVPIAEELCFRGFLQPTFDRWLESSILKPVATVLSLVVTALLFGLLHANIAAAFAAGLLYGAVYLHRRQLMDPICAHAITNMLLALYVIQSGYWSYW